MKVSLAGPEADEFVMVFERLCALRAALSLAMPKFWEFVTNSALFVMLSLTTLNP